MNVLTATAKPNEIDLSIVINHYSKAARYYDQWQLQFFEKIASTEMRTSYADLFSSRWIPPASLILEIGIGSGLNLHRYPSTSKLYGIDACPEMLHRSREKLTILDTQNVNLEKMDARRMRYPDSFFDIVVSTFTLCVTPEPHRVLHEVQRVLSPGGLFLMFEYQVAHDRFLRDQQELLAETVRQQGILYHGVPIISWDILFDPASLIKDVGTHLTIKSCEYFQKHIFESMIRMICVKT